MLRRRPRIPHRRQILRRPRIPLRPASRCRKSSSPRRRQTSLANRRSASPRLRRFRCSRRPIRPARSKPPTATSPVRARRSFRCRAPARPERSSKTCRRTVQIIPREWLIQQGDNYAAPSHHQRPPASFRGGQDSLGYFDHFLIRGLNAQIYEDGFSDGDQLGGVYAFAQRRSNRSSRQRPRLGVVRQRAARRHHQHRALPAVTGFSLGHRRTGRLVRHRRQSGLGDRTHDHQRSLLPGGHHAFRLRRIPRPRQQGF